MGQETICFLLREADAEHNLPSQYRRVLQVVICAKTGSQECPAGTIEGSIRAKYLFAQVGIAI